MAAVAEHITNIPIRYDGLDAERHEIDLYLLGESLRGFARILGVTAHFLVTGEYAKQMQALDVKVYVSEPKANCFSIHAILDFAKQYEILSGSVLLLPALLSWIFAKASNDRAEMKALQGALNNAITQLSAQNTELVPRLLATLERMVDSLRPSIKDAVAPIGKTCKKLTVGDPNSGGPTVDEIRAAAIRSPLPDEITEERTWVIRITELDLESKSAKVRFEDSETQDDGRYKAVITDPALDLVANPYIDAFSRKVPITVRGKALAREGDIQALYISDTVRDHITRQPRP